MKLTKVSAVCRKSIDYNSAEFSREALLDAGDDYNKVQLLLYEQCETMVDHVLGIDKKEKTLPKETVCSSCNSKATKKEIDFSIKKFGKVLCYNCQKKR